MQSMYQVTFIARKSSEHLSTEDREELLLVLLLTPRPTDLERGLHFACWMPGWPGQPGRVPAVDLQPPCVFILHMPSVSGADL